jgi:uncharacterized membrane protein (DUF2068 family)
LWCGVPETFEDRVTPGTEPPRRFRPKLRYELIACGLHGHELAGTDAASIRPNDALFAREDEGTRWYRCLRCDAWVALPPPAEPARPYPPDPEDISLPRRGRPLRDRFVLRVIAVERLFHLLVLGALDVAIFAFAGHRSSLKRDYTRILQDFQGGLGGPINDSKHGLLSDLNRLFTISHTELELLAFGLLVYCIVLLLEIVGLWWARRWAEYLTFIESGVLVPYELYEFTNGVSALKVIGTLLNLAILVYLVYAHRLFGARGGRAAEDAAHHRDEGWSAIVESTPLPLRLRAAQAGGVPQESEA